MFASVHLVIAEFNIKKLKEVRRMRKKRNKRNHGIIKITAFMLLACTLLTTANDVSNVQEIVTHAEKTYGEPTKN